MGAWICPKCRLHYGEEARQRCPADGERLVLNLSGASVQGHILTHLLHVTPAGSTVWEARAGQDERVALELLRGQQDAAAWALAAQLDHPRIANVTGYAAIDDDLACAVMAWIDGEPLTQQLSKGPLPVPTALHLVDQVLDALIYVHDRDCVHGDVQPNTVFFEKHTDAKLVNVGVHRLPSLVEVLGAHGSDGLALHMVAYAPPERLATGDMGPAGDLYSLGALLWHLLTGTLVFGDDPHACARAHLTAARPSLHEAYPEQTWPEGLDAFLTTALASRPADRFATAEQMRAALRPIREAARPIEAEAPPIVITEAPPRALATAPATVRPPAESEEGVAWFWMAGVGLIIISGVLIGRALVADDPHEPRRTRTAVATSAPVAKLPPVERIKATPLSTAALPAVPPSTASMSVAPPSTAIVSAASVSPSSVAQPMSVEPQGIESAAPPSAIAQSAPSAVAPTGDPVDKVASPSVATAESAPPVQVASEPAPPVPVTPKSAAPATAVAATPQTTTPQTATPKPAVARPPKIARRTVRKAAKPKSRKRSTKRRVTRAVDRVADTRAPTPREAAPKSNARTSKNGIRILGQ